MMTKNELLKVNACRNFAEFMVDKLKDEPEEWNNWCRDDEHRSVDYVVRTVNAKLDRFGIGLAKYVRDDYGFVNGRFPFDDRREIFCHNSSVPIEKLSGQYCLAKYSKGPKGLRCMKLAKLTEAPEAVDDFFFKLYSEKFEELSEERRIREEEEAERLRQKDEELKKVLNLSYAPKYDYEIGGRYGRPTVHKLVFKDVVDKDTAAKGFKCYGLEEYEEHGPAPIQYAHGTIRQSHNDKNIWLFLDYPEYTD